MLEPMQTPPTEGLFVACPVHCKEEVLRFLATRGCTVREDRDTVPPEEVLDMSPAAVLRGARGREELTQVELSRRTGIPRRHISDMENSRRPIGMQNARKLAEALNTDPRVFLRV